MVYVGVDLHRKRSHVAVLDAEGTLLLDRRIPSRASDFQRIFGELEPEPLSVVFEATYGWQWFADLLLDAGIEAHMAHPLATKAISSGRVKNDSVDARTLAHLLRTHLLPEGWIAPPDVRDRRRLVRARGSLVRMRSRLQCQVHALLAQHGVEPPVDSLFGPVGRRFLGDVGLPDVSRGRIDAALRLIDAITAEVTQLDRDLREAFRGEARLRQLLPIPGVGQLTAFFVLAEVGEVGRFRSADQLCSWAGLTPTERSSDEHTRRGHISKQGSRWLRWAMVEAAVAAARNPMLQRFHERIERRRGTKIARVALARRILTLCFYALRDPEGCRAFPVRAPRSAQARSARVMASSGTAALSD